MNFSPNRERAKAHAPWPSGHMTERVVIVIVTVGVVGVLQHRGFETTRLMTDVIECMSVAVLEGGRGNPIPVKRHRSEASNAPASK